MKKNVDAFDYAGVLCKALRKGVLLTTRSGDQVNTMTIGWGGIGVEWGKPVFIAYVRESRYTKRLLEESGEFTVNVPLSDDYQDILGYCGTKSGRDTDKIRDKNLITVESDVVSAPGIVQFPLTLECRYTRRKEQTAFPRFSFPLLRFRSPGTDNEENEPEKAAPWSSDHGRASTVPFAHRSPGDTEKAAHLSNTAPSENGC